MAKRGHVYLDYDQQRLDLNYNQAAWAPNADEIIAWYREASLAAHARLACRSFSYGASAAERIDFFPARTKGAPLVAYVHGGAWRMLDRMDSAYAALAFVKAGVNFAVIDFASIPQARLPDMVEQVRRGVERLFDRAGDLGFDPTRLALVGHSSGAHLVAAALTTPAGRPLRAAVAGALCASGAYDLEGTMLSARGKYLLLSPQEVADYSPVRHAGAFPCPVAVACGGRESDEYRRHARTLQAALPDTVRAGDLILAEGENHFEISRSLAMPGGLLFEAAMRLAEPAA